MDSAGDIFIADHDANVIREVNHLTGVITTVAGNGAPGFTSDNILAVSTELNNPTGVAVDASGNLFIADTGNNRIREVNLITGVITTVAGNGTMGFSGDHGLAVSAALNSPAGVAVDAAGDVFIADWGDNRVREVNHATGVITTIAGNGTAGYAGDKGLAVSSELNGPTGVAVDSVGDVFIADYQNNRIREVNHSTGVITTVAGNGIAGYNGDSLPGDGAELNGPTGVAVDAAGDVFIADWGNNRIREVNHSSGLISTIAGNGGEGYNSDNILAVSAELNGPWSVALDSTGDVFIADLGNESIREVNPTTRIITTVPGTAPRGYSSTTPAVAIQLNHPSAVAVDAAGDVFFADDRTNSVYEVNHVTGLVALVAGNDTAGVAGDGGLAVSAELYQPEGLAVDSAGDVFIADQGNNRIREVNHATGVITTVAGNGSAGYNGDNLLAVSAELNQPASVTVDANGNLFIADFMNNRIREVNHATGRITTVAGNGARGTTATTSSPPAPN